MKARVLCHWSSALRCGGSGLADSAGTHSARRALVGVCALPFIASTAHATASMAEVRTTAQRASDLRIRCSALRAEAAMWCFRRARASATSNSHFSGRSTARDLRRRNVWLGCVNPRPYFHRRRWRPYDHAAKAFCPVAGGSAFAPHKPQIRAGPRPAALRRRATPFGRIWLFTVIASAAVSQQPDPDGVGRVLKACSCVMGVAQQRLLAGHRRGNAAAVVVAGDGKA
jgi:hypothetical protein